MSEPDIIDYFFNATSVAVIGASKNPTKGGYRIINNLIHNRYKGLIYPVNPNYAESDSVFELKFKKSISDIEGNVDLAIFYVGNKIIPGILKDCIKKGVKVALIEAAGFEETGSKGLALKDEIVKITHNFASIRIAGPNCMGLSRFDGDYANEKERGGFCSGFGVNTDYRTGNIAIITQSGMLNGGFLTGMFTKYPDFGVRYSCSIGNKMDLGEVEFLRYVLKDEKVKVVALYLESFKNPRKFISICRNAKTIQNKTIILLKGGVTSQGSKASASHTGSLAENSQLTEAVIKQSGVIRATSFYELFQFARTASMMHKSGKIIGLNGHISIMAGSGGAGTVTSDLTMVNGLTLPDLEENSYKALLELYPDWMPPNRIALLDLWPTFEKAMMRGISREKIMNELFEIVFNDSNVEGIIYSKYCSPMFKSEGDIESLVKFFRQFPKPIFCWLIGINEEINRWSQKLSELNIPNFHNMEELVKNYSMLVQESKNREKFLKI